MTLHRIIASGCVMVLLAGVSSLAPSAGQTPDIQEQVQDLLDALRRADESRPPPTYPDKLLEPDKKQQEAIQKSAALLDAQRVECKPFHDEMPLGKFLEKLEKLLPKETLALRIDAEAFGEKRAQVAATPVSLKNLGAGSISLRGALEHALGRIKIKVDYRVGPAEVTITTPNRALSVSSYDIRDLVASFPAIGQAPGKPIADEPARQAAELVQVLVNMTDDYRSNPDIANLEAIQVLNGSRLLIQTTGKTHGRIGESLDALRRLGDVKVIVTAQLHEVDDATYKKVRDAKRPSPKDWEGENPPPQGQPLVTKETQVQQSDEVSIDNGHESLFFSRHQAVDLLASPEQVGRGDLGRQAVLEGVSFQAEVVVSADRRFVRLRLTEKASAIQEIRGGKFPKPLKNVVGAETALMRDSKQSERLDLPDGGSILVPVHYRPRTLEPKNRWWVLVISARIHIEAEERFIREGALEGLLPAVVADVVKSPRWKPVRDLYGTPDDKRFALVDSDTFHWPADLKLDLPDHQRSPAAGKGKRLLGIRVDKYQGPAGDSDKNTVTVTVSNAGGKENGAAPGGVTARYTARRLDKGWAVELSD